LFTTVVRHQDGEGRCKVGTFERGLSDDFIAALKTLAEKPGWWQDVLADASLIIGIRNEKFDVYWHGQAIFHAQFKDRRVNVNTHVKYLLDPCLDERVYLEEDGTFPVRSAAILSRYVPGTLSKLKTAADLFSGPEKQGVHAIVQANENIVDVEVTLDANGLDIKRKQPRIDIAGFEQQSDAVELVFWEAKLFANKELRASGLAEPKVVGQIKEYICVLQERPTGVLPSYRRVAGNLVAIAGMSRDARKVGPAIRAVAGGAELRISSPANVGLVIFGFDADQKVEGGIGHKHFRKLKDQLGAESVCARGDADGLKLCVLG
jgi:hypothetical protein